MDQRPNPVRPPPDRPVNLLNADEEELWPELRIARAARSRPEEVKAVYPHRWSVTRDAWRDLFSSAEREIGILAYSGLFLAEDAEILSILADKARAGVTVRICLGDPDSPHVAERGTEEGIGDAMAAKIRNALTLYRPLLDVDGIQLRLHRTVLYNSLYIADDELLVNQHAYSIPAAQAPVVHLRRRDNEDMYAAYYESLNRVWTEFSTSTSDGWHSMVCTAGDRDDLVRSLVGTGGLCVAAH